MSRVLSLLLLVFFTTGLFAQGAPAQDQSAVIQLLLKRVDELEKRVAELEQKRDDAPTAVPSVRAGAGAGADSAEQAVAAAAPATAMDAHDNIPPTSEEHYPSLRIRGFGDLDFSATDSRTQHSGFNLGQFTLHLASPLSKRISYFGEIAFIAQPNGFNVELERSLVRYDYNDLFKISFGKYHTPVNYWNTAYHHGLWLQTTISRPDMIQFGGMFLPVHFVGLLAQGSIPSGPLGLGYDAGVGNGRGLNIARAGDAGDVNNNRAWVANLYARPPKLDGLQFGGSVYQDKITLAKSPDYRELITSAHLIWTKESPEFMAEFANVRHRNVITSQAFNSKAFYVQFAYRLPGEAKPWKPYYRYDFITAPVNEPVFGDLGVQRSTLGVRYDISDLAAFKAEYRNTLQPGQSRANGLFLQTSFTF
jgi:hypothetical protein